MAEPALALRDHPQIIDLISALEQNGLQKQKEEVQALVGYIDGMEEKLSQMMDEMKEMRLEVGKLHDKGIRARCSQLVDTVEGKVHQTKVMVSTAKENLISSAKQMVQTFQEKGRSALCHAAQALLVPSVLSRMGRGFAHAEKSMGQLAVRLDAMREELHQAGGHIKNAGLALAGKEPQESKELSADKGMLAKLRSFVLSCGKAFSEMERDTALTVEQINGGRSSVKTELQGLKSAQAGQRRQAASKEQAREVQEGEKMSDKVKSRLMIAGAAFCAALFLFSGAMLCREYLDQKQSAEAFDEVAELVKEDVELPTLELADDPAQEPEELTAFEKYADVYAQNSDLVGWISIPGTRIDYPVMQAKDNPNFYLKHAFDKSYSSYGVPYMQENCDIGISDNLVLYGHHMNNGSMFSDLCKYESEDFYKEHKTIRFDTLDSFGEYEVVAAFKTVAYSEEGFKYYHFVRAEQEEDFDEFIAKCKELALYDTGVTAEYGDQLITLSTCEYSRTNGRMVVVAKLLEE